MLSLKSIKDYLSYVVTPSEWNGFTYWTTSYRVAAHFKEYCKDKTIIVTGCNGGIGFHSACAFVEHGADVIMACRASEKSTSAYEAIKAKYPSGRVTLLPIDMANPASIDSFVTLYEQTGRKHVDILLHNAGIVAHSFARNSHTGVEQSMAVNLLGPVRLTEALMPFLRSSPSTNPRVVGVSSIGAFFHGHSEPQSLARPSSEGFVGMVEYGRSKLFLSEYLRYKQDEEDEKHASESQRILYISVHPGMICTDIHRESWLMSTIMTPGVLLGGTILKSESQGGACSVFASLCNTPSFVTKCGGGFYTDCKGPCYVPGVINEPLHRKEVSELALAIVKGEIQVNTSATE